jgi:hypothetical protein
LEKVRSCSLGILPHALSFFFKESNSHNGQGNSYTGEDEQRFRLVQKGSEINASHGHGEKNCSTLSQCACANNSGEESPNSKLSSNCHNPGDPDDSSDEKQVICESNCICQSQKNQPASGGSIGDSRNNPNGLTSSIKASDIKPVLKFSVSAILGGRDRDSDKSGLDDEHSGFNPGKNHSL